MILTPEQVAEFKALGYILIPNLIDPSMLDNWRAQTRAKFGDLPDPAQQNRKDITILRGFRFSPKKTQLVPLNDTQKQATSSSGTATSCTKPLKTPATTSAMAYSPAYLTKTKRHSETKFPMISGNAGGYRQAEKV